MAIEEALGFGAKAIFRQEPVLHSMLRRNLAGEIAHAARRTDRRAGICARESRASRRQPIEIGCLDTGAAIRTHGPRAVVVGHEHHYIGLARGGARWNPEMRRRY